MGIEHLAALAGALTTEFSDGFARQYAKTAITLGSLRVIRGRGKSCNWDVEFSEGGATATAYSDGDDVQDAELNVNPIQPATIQWGLYRSSFGLTDFEVDAAGTSLAQDPQVGQIFEERMSGAFHAIAQRLNADIFSGTGTDGSGNPTIVGIFGGATDPSGIYAGINRSTYSEWGGTQNGLGGTARPLSVELMDTVESSIFDKSRQKPGLVVTTSGVRKKYKGLFESVRRIATDGMAPMRYATGTDDYLYGTAPVLRDPDCPAGKMAFLNPEYVELVQLVGPGNTPYGRIVNAVDAALREQDANGDRPLPLVCRVSPLARNGQSQRFSVSLQVALRVRRPNTCGQLIDIDES